MEANPINVIAGYFSFVNSIYLSYLLKHSIAHLSLMYYNYVSVLSEETEALCT